jgi:Ca2+-binding EF-hand superfamily protein
LNDLTILFLELSMNVSSVGGSGGFDVSKFASQVVKKSDANQDGSLDKAEFTKTLTSMGVSEEDAAKKFDSIDKGKTGKITQSDIEADMKANAKNGPPQGAQAGGARPAGGNRPDGDGDGGAGKSSSTSSSSSSSSKTYQAADTNKDGKVSAAEELIYSLKNIMAEKNKTTDSTSATEQSQTNTSSQKIGSNVDVTV